jgi:two-component system, sensor histidine kinase and response regulator
MRILVVDDQFKSRWAVADWLAVFLDSVAIESAASGSEALTTLEARRADLVLAAHPMPEMDGITLTRRLKARRDPPLVAVMADTVNAEFEALCEAAGADFWLEKRHLQARFLSFLQQRFSLRLARQAFFP